VRKNNHSS